MNSFDKVYFQLNKRCFILRKHRFIIVLCYPIHDADADVDFGAVCDVKWTSCRIKEKKRSFFSSQERQMLHGHGVVLGVGSFMANFDRSFASL